MPTPRETILAALHARLSALPATVLRSEVLPERVPAGGLVILRDGEPGEPEVTLSPVRYHWQHRAELEVVVQGKTSANRDAAFDVLTAAIGTALAADRNNPDAETIAIAQQKQAQMAQQKRLEDAKIAETEGKAQEALAKRHRHRSVLGCVTK